MGNTWNKNLPPPVQRPDAHHADTTSAPGGANLVRSAVRAALPRGAGARSGPKAVY